MQEFIWHFFIGFIVSFLGSLPIGTVNLAVVQTTVNSNFRTGFYFSLGATIIELIYSAIAIKFIAYLLNNQSVEVIIQIISVPVFIVLAILYFRKEEPSANTEIKRRRSFYNGLFIGLVNPLQIPFWIAYGSYLLSNNWIKNEEFLINVFICGISLGTLLVLTLIAFLSKKIVASLELKTRLVNRITAIVLILLAFYQILKISFHFI
jgi:threonine/homoserine/homoserine lactone efflux protein